MIVLATTKRKVDCKAKALELGRWTIWCMLEFARAISDALVHRRAMFDRE